MTFQLTHQPVLTAFQSVLTALFGSLLERDRRAQPETRQEVLFHEMIASGDLLIDSLRLEQEVKKIDLTQAEDVILARCKLQRATVERSASDYAAAVSNWREAALLTLGNSTGTRTESRRVQGEYQILRCRLLDCS